TSEISGKLSMMTCESARMVAGMRATAMFFAPVIRRDPFNGQPPSMISFSIFDSLPCRDNICTCSVLFEMMLQRDGFFPNPENFILFMLLFSSEKQKIDPQP